MTGLLIQVKRRKAKGSHIRYGIDQKAVGLFPADSRAVPRPYVTLVAEVGVQLPFSLAAITHNIVRQKIIDHGPNPPKKLPVAKQAVKKALSGLHIPQQPQIVAHPKHTHPRYSIFAYGCSATVYGVISQTDKSTYQFILGNRDEHPRQDDESLHAVREMKPFWSAGPECYRWAEAPFLQKYEDCHDHEEGLVIGKYENDTSETDQSTNMQ